MTTSLPNEGAEGSRPAMPSAADATWRIAQLQTLAVVGGIAVAFLWLFSDVLLLLFAATLLACQLSGILRAAAHRSRLPYAATMALIVILGVSLVAALIYWVGPPVGR